MVLDFKKWKNRVRQQCGASSCKRVVRPRHGADGKPSFCSYACGVQAQPDHVIMGNISR